MTQATTMLAEATVKAPAVDPVERLKDRVETGEFGEFNPNFTLADAIRMGSTETRQAYSWGQGGEACALSAAYLAAKAFGVVD